MAGSKQLLIIVGNLGSDPELKDVGSTQVCNFSVAVNESWKYKSGDKKEHTEWFRCQAWGRRGEVIAEHLHKGSQVYIEGRLRTRKWEDKDGNNRYSTDVVVQDCQFLGKGKSGGGSPAPGPQNDPDDDIPF